MARRRAGVTGPPPPVPAWVAEFILDDWHDPHEPVPLAEQAGIGEDGWRCSRAYGRWQQAGRDWLTGHGYDGSPRGWRRAAPLELWGCDPHRLAKEARRGA